MPLRCSRDRHPGLQMVLIEVLRIAAASLFHFGLKVHAGNSWKSVLVLRIGVTLSLRSIVLLGPAPSMILHCTNF
jgi:hypothetical protein